MKRILTVVLSLAMLLILASCGSNAHEDATGDSVANQDFTQKETTGTGDIVFVPPENCTAVLLITINPQIRLYLDAEGNVLAVEAVNKDAKEILEDLPVEDLHYTEAVKNIVTAANENDFIKSTTVIHIEVTEQDNHSVDEDTMRSEVSQVVEQAVPDLKLQIKIKVKENHSPEGTSPPSPDTQESTLPGGEDSTGPTQQPVTQPSTEPTQAPTEAIQCSHTYKDATCTAPKTCSKCGATSGSAAGHSYKDATCTAPKTCSKCGATEGSALGHNYIEGVCTRCSQQQENYHALNTGYWAVTKCSPLEHWDAYDIEINFKDSFLVIGYGADISKLDSDFKNELLEAYKNGDTTVKLINGVYYYFGAGDGGSITYTTSGNAVSVNCENYIHLTFERISGNQLKITGAQEAYFTNIIGTVLTWYSN